MKRDVKMFVLGLLAATTGSVVAQSWSVFSGVRFSQNGSETTPALSWTSDQNSGLYRLGADDIALTVGGAGVNTGFLELDATNAFLSGGNVQINSDDANITLTPNASGLVDIQGDAEVENFTVNGTCTGCGGGGSFPLLAPDGSFTEPSYAFTNRDSTGMWLSGEDLQLTNWDAINEDFAGISLATADAEVPTIGLVSQNGTNNSNVTLTPTLWSIGGVFAGNIVALDLTTSAITTLDLRADTFGYKGIPQISQSGNYTLAFGDGGKHIYHPSGAGAGDTFTIPDPNFIPLSGIIWQVGTVVTIVNDDANDLTINAAVTVTQAGTTATAPCTLSEHGVATVLLVTSSSYIINGAGLTC